MNVCDITHVYVQYQLIIFIQVFVDDMDVECEEQQEELLEDDLHVSEGNEVCSTKKTIKEPTKKMRNTFFQMLSFFYVFYVSWLRL